MLIVVCATEAGGASNLIPVIESNNNVKFIAFADKGAIPIFDQANIPYIACDFLSDVKAGQKNSLKLLREIKPNFILCGRSRVLGAERFLVVAAKQQEIPSVVVIDEWFDYRYNFVDNQDRTVHLPDIICCPDEMACEEAKDEGLPKDRLIPTGSPALSALMDKIESYAIKPPECPNYIKHTNLPIITFMSETHSIDYGSKAGSKGVLGNYLGYDEYSVRMDLINILKEINIKCTVIEKLHPSVNKNVVSQPDISDVTWHTISGSTPLALMWHSSIVIGMRSMALLQSALMGLPTASYQPNMKVNERCTAVRLNLIPSFTNIMGMKKWLINSLKKDNISFNRGKSLTRPFFANKKASHAVFKAITNSNSSKK